ncbi:hypothetical protein H5P36_22615 [Bacillus sp. APMAM]|nr:hypothetical protein [Bacillus sp. APMAM]RTZ53613.1 hypothetical protein EKO25_22470 [Bacillus sp. SAJ1]
MFLFIAIIIIILLIHFLIIRPLMQRNRPQVYEPRRTIYNERPDYYGPANSWNTGGIGMGRFGTFAGGLAAGALLTYLLEQGRIGFDQYQSLQNLEDHELLRELEDQNILQQDEINQLREGMDRDPQDGSQNDWNPDKEDPSYDRLDYNPNDQQGEDDISGWDDNSDDNWV